jgi:hypothetical protein
VLSLVYEKVVAFFNAWYKKSIDVGIVATNHLLSEVHNPLYATIVPLSAHLLRICETSHSEAWSFQRTCFGYMAYLEMQPLGWFGL